MDKETYYKLDELKHTVTVLAYILGGIWLVKRGLSKAVYQMTAREADQFEKAFNEGLLKNKGRTLDELQAEQDEIYNGIKRKK